MSSRFLSFSRRLPTPSPDAVIGLLLFGAGLLAYTATLAPTVLEGDAALFQYIPYALGVTYPTGYPLYILLGKLWLTLLPFGEVAWRMNLFSALCSALALPLMYGAARRLFTPPAASPAESWPPRWAALAAVLIFATIPTFWRWSTETKIYALNMLLFSGVLYGLSRALTPAIAAKRWPLALPVLLFGLQLAVHSTTVLLLPGLLLFVWLNYRALLFRRTQFAAHTLLLMLPGLLYFYIPFRAEWLIARYTRPDAIEQGLLADFYHSGLPGLIRYFTAADFTGGVVRNWGQVPEQFVSVYLPLLRDDLTIVGIALAVFGGLALAVRWPRRFFPLALLYAAPIPFVLTYGQGEQSAFLLPSFLIFSMFAGYTLVAVAALLGRWGLSRAAQLLPPLLLIGLIPLQLAPQVQYNRVWLENKWNRDIYNEWADALNHPLEPGAGLLAHWGDLTSFWYMQQVEQRRPDLRGVYPPTEASVIDWFNRGKPDLYIAGPLQGWADGLEERYQFIPWGQLVKIAPKNLPPESLLPALPQPIDTTFGGNLRLLGVDFAPHASAGGSYPVTLSWQALTELDNRTRISLRLAQDNIIVAQWDDRPYSGWFPRETLPAGQYLLSYPLLPIPAGTLPGRYRLQLVAYQDARRPWLLPDGSPVLDLGEVAVVSPPYPPVPAEYRQPAPHDFNHEISLAGYSYSVSRVGQGKGFALQLLWQAVETPADNYTLRVEQLDPAGNILRTNEFQPVDGRAPTSSWQPGQFIRDQVNLIVPAAAPPGEEALQIRLSWRRPNGSALNLRRWGIPLDDGLTLPPLEVVEKAERNFTLPEMGHRVEANLDNKARLVGYSIEQSQFRRADCATGTCTLKIELIWQGVGEMAEPYQVFLHVVDEAGQIVAQHDRTPGARGKQPTTGWLPGEVVADPIELALPPEMAAGTYTLRVGLYHPPSQRRLPVIGQTGADFVDIGVIEVTSE